MRWGLKVLLAVGALSLLTGCASLQDKFSPSGPDAVTQAFFTHLERSQREEAYSLFAKGLSQTLSFGQFDQLMDAFEDKWGKIESEDTAVMPFHKREGEQRFIPLGASADQVKRYIYDVKFEHAQVNCDLTLVLDGSQYKIVWISFWGSSVYMTPDITQKMEELFSKPSDT